MGAHVRILGAWETVDQIYARVGGTWKDVDAGFVKLSGAWEQFFSSAAPSALTIDFLVIAGGGGGGKAVGGFTDTGTGGGGAGGYRCSVAGELSGGSSSPEAAFAGDVATSYTVTIGAGQPEEINGLNSVFANIIAIGGGTGGQQSAGNGVAGGSGGGAGHPGGTGGAGVVSQGSNGGNAVNSPNASAGGGGAGGAGGNSSGNTPGIKGAGLSSSITGTSILRAEGGKGNFGTASIANGGANTGTGGDGGVNNRGAGGSGGSGIVILKYPDTFGITVGAGLTADTPPASGGFKVTTFTAGTGTISFS